MGPSLSDRFLRIPIFRHSHMREKTTFGINPPFGRLSPTQRQVAHALLTRPPLSLQCIATSELTFDLHASSTPPAFVLSQDQTLRSKINLTINTRTPAFPAKGTQGHKFSWLIAYAISTHSQALAPPHTTPSQVSCRQSDKPYRF